MANLYSIQGPNLQAASENAAHDTFAPMIVMAPIAGFPKAISTPNGFGQPVILAARDRLTKFKVADNDRKLDRVEITFLDEDGYFGDPANLAHGSVLDIAYGYKGNMSTERRLIVRRVQLEAMQGKASAKRRKGFIVTIEGQAPGIVGLYDDGADVDVFENTRLSAIVRVLANRLGYSETGRGASKLRIHIPKDDDLIERVLTKPAALKVPQFIKYIADRYGFLLCTGKGGMYFGIRDYEQNPGEVINAHNSTLISYKLDGDLNLPIPKELQVSGVTKGSFNYLTLKATIAEKGKDDTNLDFSSGSTDESVVNAGTAGDLVEEPSTKQAVPSSGAKRGGFVVVNKRAMGSGQAIRRRNTVMRDFRPVLGGKADIAIIKRFKQRINRLWKLSITTVGNPKLVAGTVVSLQNFDTPLLDGDWYITQATHTFDQNYTTELRMHRRRAQHKGTNKLTQVTLEKTATTDEEKALAFRPSPANETPKVKGGFVVVHGSRNTYAGGTLVDIKQQQRGRK